MKLENAIPIIIVAGFLGAGKTSLINHLLKAAASQFQMVVVNDFGAEKLDAHLMVSRVIVQRIHGCICCSSHRSLQKVIVQSVSAESPPKKILMEASGVADPDKIAQALKIPELKTRVAVQQIITVVAVDQILALKGEMAELAKTQLTAASQVIVNKIDLVSEGQLDSVLGWLQAVKADIPVLTTSHGALPTEFLQGSRVLKSTVSEEIIHDSKP